MKRSEMSKEQLSQRSFIVERLTLAGWQGTNINTSFEAGRYEPHEVAMLRSGKGTDLRIDVHCKEKQLFLYIFGSDSKRLELMFEYEGYLESLLTQIIAIQDDISGTNFRSYTGRLIDACPECYTFTSGGQKARVVKGAAGPA